jgi:DNA-binding XRE family transcriptional regulator
VAVIGRARHHLRHEEPSAPDRPTTMQASRRALLSGWPGQVIDGQTGNFSDGAKVLGRHPAPLADGGMRDVAGACNTHDHAALIEQGGESGFPVHAGMLSENPTTRKREVAPTVGSSYFAVRDIRPHIARMAILNLDDVARRLKAIRAEMAKEPPELAEMIGASKSAYYQWEKGSTASKPNFPGKQAMANLCDVLPGLDLDYIYRGKLDGMPPHLGIKLVAREMGIEPTDPGAKLAWAAAIAEQAA